MKIAQMTGAYVNAGDFLIQERANALLRYAFPSAEIKIFQAKEDAISCFDEINKCDAIIVEGGPYIMEDISYDLPIDSYMSFCPPIMFLGVGQYLNDGSKDTNYSLSFTKATLDLLKKVTENGLGISCRDIYTYRALENAELQNIHMTGCPAWFNIPYISQSHARGTGEIKNICVSDPARYENNEQVIELIEFLEKRYPKATITYIIHRDVNDYLVSILKDRFPNVKISIISGSTSGFSLYDECDLHVGYRVHAHIYNLSIRNKSILIEEDARGAGVNEALGLVRIAAYDDNISHIKRKWPRVWKSSRLRNTHVMQELSAYLDVCELMNWQYMNNAFALQQQYFNQMLNFVKRIEK